ALLADRLDARRHVGELQALGFRGGIQRSALLAGRCIEGGARVDRTDALPSPSGTSSPLSSVSPSPASPSPRSCSSSSLQPVFECVTTDGVMAMPSREMLAGAQLGNSICCPSNLPSRRPHWPPPACWNGCSSR